MGMFRSETMKHGTLVLPADGAREFIELLGMKAHIQFVDMNAQIMQRQYKRYIQRIDEMERILRFLFEEIGKLPGTQVVAGDVDSFLASDLGYQLDSVEDALQRVYKHFQNFRDNNLELVAQKNAAIEEYAVTKVALASLFSAQQGGNGGRFGTGGRPSFTDGDFPALASIEGGGGGPVTSAQPGSGQGGPMMGFTNIAGVIPTDDQEKLARTLFRATRGNAFSHFESVDEKIMDPKTNKPVQKSVFVAYFQAGATVHSALRDKILRICQAYNVNIYEWPRSAAEARAKLTRLEDTITERARALEACEEFYVAESSALLEVHREKGGSLIEDYRLFCLKEKALYATLNLFEGVDVTLRADCWFPAMEEEDIRRLLITNSRPGQASAFLLTDRASHNVVSHGGGGAGVMTSSPPTYIRTTEFTSVFQSFVDTYGVPRYQEANPALVTIVTFPFLFGIMYGDIGHGACVLAFGLFLVLRWGVIKRAKDEIVQMIGGGRYMILFMGLFAVYAGFLYNDFFSLGLDIFGTRYHEDHRSGDSIYLKLDRSRTPYPFGFDPAWKGASNELTYTNSFKMKFAVIIGFAQMTLGVIFKGCNSVFFRDPLTFFFEFIPQLVFMLALVGFMDVMIFYKWITPTIHNYWKGLDNKPLIINNIIQMCMFAEPDQIAFKGQQTTMKVCMTLMILSIPIMLLVKPLSLKAIHDRRERKRNRQYTAIDKNANVDLERGEQKESEELAEPFEFGEEFIHQVIETIEFALGTISNTASYLRLWALSLAHQQLSLVFFNMTIKIVLAMDMSAVAVGIILFFVFAIFAGITFGVLLCMDTLECFLHALRLQWVEFQNKFYKADGYPFTPFSFKKALTYTGD